jgi:VanZ family protein
VTVPEADPPPSRGFRQALADGLRARRFWRISFWCYAPALFAATHWPALRVDVPGVERPDLLVHFVCFGAWAALLALTQYTGPLGRTRSFGRAWIIALVCAAVDEGSQAIPILRRTAVWDDLVANLIGVTLGIVVVIVVCRILAIRHSSTAELPS